MTAGQNKRVFAWLVGWSWWSFWCTPGRIATTVTWKFLLCVRHTLVQLETCSSGAELRVIVKLVCREPGWLHANETLILSTQSVLLRWQATPPTLLLLIVFCSSGVVFSRNQPFQSRPPWSCGFITWNHVFGTATSSYSFVSLAAMIPWTILSHFVGVIGDPY